MEFKELDLLIENFSKGLIDASEFKTKIADILQQEIVSEVIFDINREKTSGIPEVVLAESKDPDICVKIAEKIIPVKKVLLYTRCLPQHYTFFEQKTFPSNWIFEFNKRARTILIYTNDYHFLNDPHNGLVALITAGTTDIPFAEEALITLKLLNVAADSYYDVGIAGLHRLQRPIKKILETRPDCVIVFAGMEGALPSVVASLIDIPVIGVPISVGSYGYGDKGQAALMTMLQSCSPGLAVVNIDGGFRAATIAGLIAKNAHHTK